MKEVKLYVTINRDQKSVFEFTCNPQNTPKWIDSIVREEASMGEVAVGTTYKNWDTEGKVNEYVVTIYEPYTCFQLDATHQDYKVKYSYREIDPNVTELEYHEWSESGQLHAPFMQEILDRLKMVLEKESD